MKNTGHIALILCIALLVYLIGERILGVNENKIGVVQMEKLVYEFKGMKEATQRYSAKMKQWGMESDTLEKELSQLYKQMQLDSTANNQLELEKHSRTYLLMRKKYIESMQSTRERAGEEDKQMTSGVLNQLNDYIKLYAEEEGYDVILCNNQQQSVGYVKEQIDITEEVLDYANKKYDGVK